MTSVVARRRIMGMQSNDEYAAPTGLGRFVSSGYYKYSAPDGAKTRPVPQGAKHLPHRIQTGTSPAPLGAKYL